MPLKPILTGSWGMGSAVTVAHVVALVALSRLDGPPVAPPVPLAIQVAFAAPDDPASNPGPAPDEGPSPLPQAARLPPSPEPVRTPDPVLAASDPAPTSTPEIQEVPLQEAPVAGLLAPSAPSASSDGGATGAGGQDEGELAESSDYLTNPAPSYPIVSRLLGEEGRVLVRVLVDTSFGFEHFLSHLDGVGRLVLLALGLLSVSSWTVAARKAWRTFSLSRRETRVLSRWTLARELVADPSGADPWSRVLRRGLSSVDRLSHAAPDSALGLQAPEEFVATSLGRVVQEEIEEMERGLVRVATTSSAAPFVGLFGTVWSIYHALVAIGRSGEGGLDKVAGPVGEALVMTGIGLAVAIPALVAYNALAAWQRGLGFRLEGFAHLATDPVRSAASAQRDIVASGRP